MRDVIRTNRLEHPTNAGSNLELKALKSPQENGKTEPLMSESNNPKNGLKTDEVCIVKNLEKAYNDQDIESYCEQKESLFPREDVKAKPLTSKYSRSENWKEGPTTDKVGCVKDLENIYNDRDIESNFERKDSRFTQEDVKAETFTSKSTRKSKDGFNTEEDDKDKNYENTSDDRDDDAIWTINEDGVKVRKSGKENILTICRYPKLIVRTLIIVFNW